MIAVSDQILLMDLMRRSYGARYPNMTIIPAIELSTDVPDDEVHMLGYFIDYEDREFQNILDKFPEGRLDRGQLMVKSWPNMDEY
ncbi:MAG: hypothetical protein CM1200mP15_16830 [Dehalococcoidia bacterium]|nr:MAG: hypothetical protein CM1200mP15_16830 [Dehalococcoidia bacterium]